MCVLLAFAVLGVPVGASSQEPDVLVVPQDRSVEAVILKGADFPRWSAGPEIVFREPQAPLDPLGTSDCRDEGDHNCYQSSRVPNNPNEGVPVDRLIGYRWDTETESMVEIPLQVDEVFTRHISNNASGFAFYSNVERHTTYAFDREGFRFTAHDPDDLCVALPRDGVATTADPIRGLDDLDEIVFLYRDAGPSVQAPAEHLPEGIADVSAVRVDDPSEPGAEARYVYIGLADEDGPRPSFDASNGYIRYERDPGRNGADLFLYSQSSYSDYGNAPRGPHCDDAGNLVTDADGNPVIAQRRPRDTATVFTPRYAFRYEGRWLMTGIHVAPTDLDGPASSVDAYGPDLVDQWKARAFQQRPGGQTPCCGYEEEVNNWGGSSILMGERAGPIRVIRETWGADSATNNIRREVFYPEQIRFENELRVHPIPPLDGIYVQWDYNAGVVDTYRNPWVPDGVPVDGQNDEVFGNIYAHVARDKVGVSTDDDMPVVGPQEHFVPLGGEYDNCRIEGERSFCNDIDLQDPTFSGPVGNLNWEQVSGPHGTLVTRWAVRDVTPGGTPQAVIAQPYYRDDSCFDDGTGSDPGPHLNSRRPDDGDAAFWWHPETGEKLERECWHPDHGPPTGDPEWDRRWWQGSIGTHGLHLHIVAESDNAATTLPVTEISSEQRMVVLTGDPGNVGERHGRHVEHPLRTTVL